MTKSLRERLAEWHFRDKVFVVCGAVMVVAGLADLTFERSYSPLGDAWGVLVGVFCLCVGIYNLARVDTKD